MRSVLVVAVVLSAGCNLYWGHHGGDDVCAADDYAPAFEVRDPNTGNCLAEGGGYDCSCGPCPGYGGGAVALPAGPSCYGACEGLDEFACLSTAGCHATFVDDAGAVTPVFWECWDTTPANGIPPNTTGACDQLDATSCAFRDDCLGYFSAVGGPFQVCVAEPTAMSCDETTCQTGSHCEQQCTDSTMCRAYCVPDDLCAAVTCGTGSACVETCDPTTGTCSATCVAATACAALATETDCTSRSDCEPVYKGDDCTCLPDGCTCTIETYERCQAR
jgi:hypothetical protein